MNEHKRPAFAVAVVLIAMMTAFAIPASAVSPSVDVSTTDATTSVSMLQDDTVVTNVSGLHDDDLIVQVNMTNSDEVEMEVSRNDSSTVVATNTSALNVSAGGAGSTHWNTSVLESDIDDMERQMNENVTTDFVVYNATNSTESTTVTAFLNFSDDRSVVNIDDTVVDDEDIVESRTLENTLFDFRLEDKDEAEVDTDERTITSEDSFVVLAFTNDTFSSTYSEAVSDDAEDQDILWGMTMVVTGDDSGAHPVVVYNEEIPDDGVDEDEDTYGIYKEGEIGGQDGIEVHLGDEFEDDDDVEVDSFGNAGFIEQLRTYGIARVTGNRIETGRLNPFSLIGGPIADAGGLTAAGLLSISAVPARKGEIVFDDEDEEAEA